jgi:phosphatidylcholine synthase
MFLWLGVALIVDGIDGTFARRLRIAELPPRWRIVKLMALVFWAMLAISTPMERLDSPTWTAALIAVIAIYFAIVGPLRSQAP